MIRYFASFALLCFATGTVQADWPTWAHDNTRVAATDEVIQLPLDQGWVHRSAVAPASAWEGPRDTPIEGHVMKHRVRFDDAHHVAIVGDRVYYGSIIDHSLRCVDAKDGRTVWRFFTEGPIRLAPTVADGRVWFGSDDGIVYCLDARSGELVVKHRVGPADERILARGKMISRWPVRTGVLVADGTAYFGAGIFPHETVYLCAADAKTGEILWKNDHISQQDAGRNDLSPQGYLLANQDLLFVPSGRSLPATFDRRTGQFRYKKSFSWRSSAGGVVGGSRAILADGQLYSSGAHHFLALNQETGNAGYAYIPGRQITFRGGRAYIATGKEILAVDRDEHAKASVKRQALFIKRRSYRGNREKLAELDKQMNVLANEGVLWRADFAGDSSLTLTGNLVLAGGFGQVKGFDIQSGEQVWSAKVDGEARGIAAANGLVAVSTTSGHIYSFGSRESVAARPREPFSPDKLTKMYSAAADDILQQSGVTSGFCLILGSENGRLAYELAKRSKLTIFGIEADADKVTRSREALDAAGLYGHRVSITQGQPDKAPFSNYFANLVVSDSMLLTGKLPLAAVELGRFVKPCGGVACFGVPDEPVAQIESLAELKGDVQAMYLRDDAEIRSDDSWVVLTRGKLDGAGDWSHQYGDVGNTSFSDDHRVRGSLGVLWYGDPGPSQMINRHEAASAPLSTNGRFFVQGTESVRGFDSYNGQFLWEFKNPGAIRTGVFNNFETSNLAANDDNVFVCANDTCTVLDAANGKVKHLFKTPKSADGLERDWGYIASYDGLLFGSSTMRSDLTASLRRRGRVAATQTDAVFAVDPETGKQRWIYHNRDEHLLHTSITIGDGRMFFIESSISMAQRDALLRQEKEGLKDLPADQAKKKEAELKAKDYRHVVALDAKTGKQLWREPVEVTFCSGVSAGGGNLSLMYSDGHLVISGANANGHYWRQFMAGEFNKRRLVTLNADTGKLAWKPVDANHMNRAVIVNGDIVAEPFAFDLKTGEPKKRTHPLTGQEINWQFSRPGHHCGVITSTPNMMFFRSGFIGYYDLYADSGTRHFAGQRLGCWVNAIPAGGLVLIPEASAGCVCLFSITSTVVLEPREDREPSWGIYSTAGSSTPVKHVAVNLGAPGDRRDGFGTLWLSYPRPKTVNRMEYVFDIKPKLASGGSYFDKNSESLQVAGADVPWVFASGVRGLSRCEIPLRGKQDEPADYTVKLYFADLEGSKPGQRVFDIQLQGTTVAKDVDIAASGGKSTAVIRKFDGIRVSDNLSIELIPADGGADGLPELAGIEVSLP